VAGRLSACLLVAAAATASVATLARGQEPAKAPAVAFTEVLYARSAVWYVQPYVAEPFTAIQSDSTWHATIHLGTDYAALLVGPGYRPAATLTALPASGNGIVAIATVEGSPFWWQTRGFRGSMIVLLAAMAWGIYRIHVAQVTRRLNQRFEERLDERTRIAQELHDTLLQGFLSASMQLHVVADRLPEGSPVRPSLDRVLDLMTTVIGEGRNALRDLRASPAHDRKLEDAFSRIPSEIGLERKADYRVIVEGRARPLNPIVRDELYRIGREALFNAFRHAGAERVEVALEYGPAALRMLVRDNGRGIDAEVLHGGSEGHWGLPGMHERAHRIGAQFKVWSRPAAGTEIEVAVPARLAFHEPSVHAEKIS
jgi:signal transduction histidine kinase